MKRYRVNTLNYTGLELHRSGNLVLHSEAKAEIDDLKKQLAVAERACRIMAVENEYVIETDKYIERTFALAKDRIEKEARG